MLVWKFFIEPHRSVFDIEKEKKERKTRHVFPGRILFQPGHPYTYTSRKNWKCFLKTSHRWVLHRRAHRWKQTEQPSLEMGSEEAGGGGGSHWGATAPTAWPPAFVGISMGVRGPGGSALPSTIATFLYSSRSFCIYMVILPVYFNTTDFSISLFIKVNKKITNKFRGKCMFNSGTRCVKTFC